MKGLVTGLVLLLQAACSLAAPSPVKSPAEADLVAVRDVGLEPRGWYSGRNCNTRKNRACWRDDGWDINTDYETGVPYTGRTRKYTLTITEVGNWTGPDGRVKEGTMLINGGFPGPTIKADWGDMIEVTVVNQLELNGTSIHWHGIRMFNNNVNDGANGVTECPIAPGKSKKYHFLAEQYGTTWYHSHFSSQYANGVVGAIQIDGPASRNYDIDLGTLQITDWYYEPADVIATRLNAVPQAPPPSDNIFFNGQAVGPDGKGGAYHRMMLMPGRRHRLRIINPSVDNTFSVSLVNHNFTVIQTDLVPVKPSAPVSSIFLAIGQRVDVTIDADQRVDSYWFNVTMDPSGLCGTTRAVRPAMIFQYRGARGNRLPTINGTLPPSPGCGDVFNYEPVVPRTATAEGFQVTDHNEFDVVLATGGPTVKWNIHGQDINITWDEPTLEYVARGQTSIPGRYNVISNDAADNQWTYWVVQNFGVVPHPMHLHGHDFLIVGKSAPVANPFGVTVEQFNTTLAFQYDRDVGKLDFNNPTRRDVTMLASWGWIVLAFRADNPGAWLMHCHIAWHVSQGLGMQFLERVADIPSAITLGELEPTCSDWTAYWNTVRPHQYDSGL